MDPKLLCPTLTIMLTKTIKALCEVNIKFDKKLEISGSLHVRSDGEKILTCLIDEDSTRTVTGGSFHQRSTPETALAQQSAVMALLTASQQMAANRSPGLISPPARNHTPGDGGGGGGANQGNNLQTKSTQQGQPSNTTNSTQENHYSHEQQQHHHHHNHPMNITPHNNNNNTLVMGGGMEHLHLNQHHQLPALPPVNSFIQHKHDRNDREVLLGMLQDKSKKLSEPSTTPHNTHFPLQVINVKQEPSEQEKQPQSTTQLTISTTTQPQLTTSTPTPLPPAITTIQPDHKEEPTTTSTATTAITVNGISGGTTVAIAGLPPLAALPPFPVLVGGANWPAPPTQNLAAIATVPVAVSGATPPTLSITAKSDPDSPPRENEYVTTINSKGQKKFQCMFCGILLSTKNYLKNHINAVHTKARVYPCEICERYFYSAGALRIHKLRHHWAGSKKHKCHHCHDTFLLPVELRRHLVKKHGDTSGGHSEDENGDVNSGGGAVVAAGGGNRGKTDGSGGLTIQQIHQLQLREQLRAQQHLYEQEQAIHNLQRHMSDQNSPIELSGRGDSLSEEHEPGEVLNDEMNSHMTVIVEPEAPDDITDDNMDTEIHPNQNEIGIPDDEMNEIHEVTLEEITKVRGKGRVQVEYVAQSQTVGDGGD